MEGQKMRGAWHRSEDEVLATLQDVVAIESVNPSLPGGRDGEAGMVEYLSAFFEGIGLPVELTEALPGRHNLVATSRGRTRTGPCSSSATWTRLPSKS